MEIVGEQATLVIPNPFLPGLWEKPYLVRGKKKERVKVKGAFPFSGEVENMADAIILGKKPCISLEDSRANITALLGLFESARTGKPVTL
jgi:predicted dehydrogenase